MKILAISIVLLISGCALNDSTPFRIGDISDNSEEWRIPASQYNSSKTNENRTVSDFKYIFRNWEKYNQCLIDFSEEKNEEKYKTLCMRAAVDGYFYSQRELAFEYASVNQDIVKSVEWYESAVLGGDKMAMHNLGLIYGMRHKLIRRNIKLAVELLESGGDYLNSSSRGKLADLRKELNSR